MGKYRYTAINKKGEKVTGVIEAVSQDEVASVLIESGVTPIKVVENIDILNILEPSLNTKKVPTKEKVIFLREFATMVSAGLPLDDALEVASAQMTNKTFKNIVIEITKAVRSGQSLANAFGKFPKVFSPIEISLIKAGEVSGKMDAILSRLADDVEKSALLGGKVKGALSYPIFVLGIAGIVIAVITVKLVPAVQDLYAGFGNASLPVPTQILVDFSNLVSGYWWLLIIIMLFCAVSFRYYTSTPEGKYVVDSLVVKIPVIGELMAKYQVVIFIKTYSMLTASGIPVINSLNLVGDSMSNAMFAKGIHDATKEVEKGVSLAEALSRYDFIPSILWRSIGIGEETGKTEEILEKIGNYFETQVNDAINNLTRLIEPLLLVVLGGIVGFIAVSIYLPIYNFSSVVH